MGEQIAALLDHVAVALGIGVMIEKRRRRDALPPPVAQEMHQRVHPPVALRHLAGVIGGVEHRAGVATLVGAIGQVMGDGVDASFGHIRVHQPIEIGVEQIG
ncbi:hypothetical protein [Rhodophyticola sp.]|uniref:hypothetical protein n=1 Tax=Rhodophyticola sp. TaxID=2680032 RepID=UPI003D2E7F47